MKYSIGVDIGGTKVLSALMDHTGKVHETVEIPSDIKTEETLFQSVTSSVNMLLKKKWKDFRGNQRYRCGCSGLCRYR